MPIINVNGANLFYKESGRGDKYIVSGHMHVYEDGNYRLELVKKGYHLIEVELRGYGRSEHVTEDLGETWYDVWASDCCEVAKALGIDKFIYTGLSHGAGVGWHILKNQSEVLLGFAGLVGGPHKRDGIETGAARQRTIEAASSEEGWLEYCHGFFKSDQMDFTPDMSEEEIVNLKKWHAEKYQCYRDMAYEERIISPKKPLPQIKTEEELISFLGKQTVPALFIGGMKDTISTSESMMRTAAAYGGSKTIMLNYGTHMVGAQYSGRVANEIDLFIKEGNLFTL